MNWLQNSIAIIISFLIARIMIDSDIHKVYVRMLLIRSGARLSSFITGILLTSYFFSIFFSNTVVVLSMIPVIKIILESINDESQRRQISSPVILAMVYGANIGGMASITGCPLNILFSGIIEVYNLPGKENITFFSWLLVGVPATFILIVISRLVLKLAGCPDLQLNRLIIQQECTARRNVTKYTVFFIVNMVLLVGLTAVQFWLIPAPLVYGLNPIDILMIVYLLGFLFFGFIYPRGENLLSKYKQNAMFLVFFVIFFIPICLVELMKDVISRFRLRGAGGMKKFSDRFFSIFNSIWYFFFKERQDSLESRNPHAFISLNRLLYDLPFFGLLFMGVVLLAVFILIKIGDNPATTNIDGYVVGFLEGISLGISPSPDHLFLFMLAIVMISIFFTELINNTAVVLMMFPFVLKIVAPLPVEPLVALLAVTIAASGAFMTPIATPVNAISYASFKGVSLKKMMALGFLLNLLSGLYIALLFFLFF